jgi:phenylphosphate carboxylase gamma subunit
MDRHQWEVFVMDLGELAEGRDLELTIRTLDPGIHKYTYKRAKVRVSADLGALPDDLQVRFGRGQLAPQRYSMRLLEEVERLPAKYR